MKNIKKLRYQLGITQEQMANQLGFTKSHVSFLEKNSTKTLAPKTIEKLKKLFDCSVYDLYGVEILKIEPQNDEEKLKVIKILIDSLENKEILNDYFKEN